MFDVAHRRGCWRGDNRCCRGRRDMWRVLTPERNSRAIQVRPRGMTLNLRGRSRDNADYITRARKI